MLVYEQQEARHLLLKSNDQMLLFSEWLFQLSQRRQSEYKLMMMNVGAETQI